MTDLSQIPKNLIFGFDIGSPYSYLGYKILQRYKKKWDLNVNYMPVNLLKIFKQSENAPPSVASPTKGKYLSKDINYLAEFYEVKLKFPKKFVNTKLTLQVLTVINESKPEFFESFLDSVWDAYYVDSKDISQMDVISDLVNAKFGSQTKKILEEANTETIKNKVDMNTETIVKQGGFGLPFFKFENEKNVLFGSDRLALIAWRLGKEYEGPVPGRTLSQPDDSFKKTRKLTFYYDMLSPYSYIARKIFQKFEPEWGIKVDYKPVLLPVIMRESGNKGPTFGSRNKRIYTIKDLSLVSKAYDIPYSLPTKFPFATLVGQTLLSILRERRPEKYMYSLNILWDAVVLEHKDVNDPSVLKNLLRPLSIHDINSLIRDACKPVHQEKLINFSKELVKNDGAFGLPYFHAKHDNEARFFFGSDRIGALAHFLKLPYSEPLRKLNVVELKRTKL